MWITIHNEKFHSADIFLQLGWYIKTQRNMPSYHFLATPNPPIKRVIQVSIKYNIVTFDLFAIACYTLKYR